jgi:hypothetical protein
MVFQFKMRIMELPFEIEWAKKLPCELRTCATIKGVLGSKDRCGIPYKKFLKILKCLFLLHFA